MHTYRCPFCAARVEVSTEAVGHGVSCPQCARPFVAHAPEGVLIEEAEDGTWRPALRGTTRGGESTVRTLHPEPLRSAPGVATVSFLALAACVISVIASFGAEGGARSAFHAVALIGALIAVLLIAWRRFETRFETLEITTRRSIWARGILDRSSSEVEHEDIRNIQVKQGLFERMLGVGTVAISSAGQDDMEIQVRGLRKPDEVVALVRRYQAGANSSD